MKFFNAGKIFIILKNEMLAVKKKKDNFKKWNAGKIFFKKSIDKLLFIWYSLDADTANIILYGGLFNEGL